MGSRSAARANEEELEELAGYLNALAHPRRLQVLQQLRVPRAVAEIQIKPWRKGADASPDRPLSRNAVERHLALLRAIGVVQSRDGERDGRAVNEYVLQHQRLFQIVEELRELTQLRPIAEADTTATVADEGPLRAPDTAGPHVALLSGPREGTVHALKDNDDAWMVGRATDCHVALDYDPYVSGEHALIAREGDGFAVRDLPSNRNGTFVNWRAIPRGGTAPLSTGDVLRVGRSLLLFRAAPP